MVDALSKSSGIIGQGKIHKPLHLQQAQELAEGGANKGEALYYTPPKEPGFIRDIKGKLIPVAEFESMPVLNTALLYKALSPQNISFLHDVILDSDTMPSLRDITMPSCFRNETNKLYLLIVASIRNSIKPFTEKDGTFY